jgi:hypothetical protein
MNPLSEKSKEELKKILRTELGEEKVKLLNDDDMQQVGMFLLVLRSEAIKRRMRERKTTSMPEGSHDYT